MLDKIRGPITWVLVASIAALGLFLTALVLSNAYKQVRLPEKTITVTGSAKKQIKSDLVVWKGYYTSQAKTLPEAYAKLNADNGKIKAYFAQNGLDDKQVIFSAITSNPFYEYLPNGMMTSNIQSYKLTQEIEIRSNDIEKITGISRQVTTLINDGVEFQSIQPQYICTKIADLKVDMLALAMKDAANRAEKIAQNAGAKVKGVKTAKMGVFQITPLYSTEVSDYGISDTSSIDKEITGIVNCVFTIE